MLLKRNISFSVYATWRNYSSLREARFLKKLICKGEQKSLKKTSVPKSVSMNDYARNMLYSPATKRLLVLNKVFMEHVSDLTTTGQYCDELNRLGIQVVKAKVSPNYHVLFLYWIHTRPIVEEEVAKLLPEVASYLRFELGTMKVMGRVPEVRFVKHEAMVEMEIMQKILTDLSFINSIDSNINEEEEMVESEDNVNHVVNTNESVNMDRVLSDMKQNVYGLDYPRILQNIIKEKTRRQPNEWEREGLSGVSTDSVKIKFDKKMLSKVIFKDSYELRKQRRLNKQLMGIINSDKDLETEEDDVEFYQDIDNVDIDVDDSKVDEEVKRILDGDSCLNEATDTNKTS